jgi:hypothetical protein
MKALEKWAIHQDEAAGPVANDSRAKEIYDRWAIWGETQQQIAKKYGLSQQRVSQIVKAWRAANPAVREDLAAQSIAMLNELRDRQFRLAEQIKAGAPVAVGKDGNKLYEDDEDGTRGAGLLRLPPGAGRGASHRRADRQAHGPGRAGSAGVHADRALRDRRGGQ